MLQCWENYRIEDSTKEFKQLKLDLLKNSEVLIQDTGNIKFGGIKFIYSGRKDGVQWAVSKAHNE